MLTTESQLPPQFEGVLDTNNEQVLWVGKPAWGPFMLTGVPFLIIGLIWGMLDFGFIGFMRADRLGSGPPLFFIVPFFVLHSFPFWGSILNMVRLALVHGNTFYAFTNKRVLLRSGFWGTDFKAIDFDRIQDLTVTVNPVENMLGVGTIKAFTGAMSSKGAPVFDRFIAVEQPYEVFKRLKQVSVDVKTDWNFPNAMRPGTNPGYNTEYKERT